VSFLIDTNVLLRSIDTEHAMYADAVSATSTLLDRGEALYVISQNLIEFWRTCTRPADRNGFGMTTSQALVELKRIESIFPRLPDVPDLYDEWRKLVLTHEVLGVQVHDARLVAAMQVHGIENILTFNVQDFRRYTEITVVHPAEIA